MNDVQHMAVGESSIAFQIVGEDRPGLVFLHEGLGSIELWRGFPGSVVAGTGESALVYDRRGHGRSSPLSAPRDQGYLHEAALEELPEMLTGIEDPILIGHSDGATIALLYASRHTVAGLVLIAPHVYVEPAATTGIQRTDRDAAALVRRLERYHDRAGPLYAAWRDIWLDEAFADWDITEEIRLVDAPMLLIQGQLDEYGTLDQLDRIQTAVGAPAERLVVEGAGHSPHLTHPAQVTPAVVRFVRKIRTTGDETAGGTGSARR